MDKAEPQVGNPLAGTAVVLDKSTQERAGTEGMVDTESGQMGRESSIRQADVVAAVFQRYGQMGGIDDVDSHLGGLLLPVVIRTGPEV